MTRPTPKHSAKVRAARRAAEKRQALRLKQRVFNALGWCCAKCGSKKELSVDHINGREWKVEGMSWRSRLRRYLREIEQGVALRTLCSRCNSGYRPHKAKGFVGAETTPDGQPIPMWDGKGREITPAKKAA